MKARLLFPARDLPAEAHPPVNEADLRADLGLDVILDAMSDGDGVLRDIAGRLLMESLTDTDDIVYRQQVLRDCLDNEQAVRELYDLAVDALDRERHVYGWLTSRTPSGILHRSIEVLEIFVDVLRHVRALAADSRGTFTSPGLTRFFEMTLTELDDAYFQEVEAHLKRLRFRGGILMSAALDHGGRGVELVLRRPTVEKPTLGERLDSFTHPDPYFRVADRDEAGMNALSELEGRALNLAADAVARSTDHILSFFRALRAELAFYLGCLNLHRRLSETGQPVTFPEPRAGSRPLLEAEHLYDPALALLGEQNVVGNEVHTAERGLVMITGANRGGKSTFLRSVGIAQLMTQAGMFAPAATLTIALASGVFTHFRREEDAGLESGKFDEELSRMSVIVDRLRPGALMLFNESFAATDEREGSQIGEQIVRALRERDIRVLFVTHQFTLAHAFVGEDDVLFLRADRERTFRLSEGEPLSTAHGEDLYRTIFHTDPQAEPERSSTT